MTESQSLSVQRYNVAADDGRGLVHLDGCVALNGCSPPATINVFTDSARYEMALLHFACVVDDAKCIAVRRVCVCLCVACLHYCTDPDATWGSGRGCPLVVHYWANLQSMYGLRCYGNITQTRNVSEDMFVLALYLVVKQVVKII